MNSKTPLADVFAKEISAAIRAERRAFIEILDQLAVDCDSIKLSKRIAVFRERFVDEKDLPASLAMQSVYAIQCADPDGHLIQNQRAEIYLLRKLIEDLRESAGKA